MIGLYTLACFRLDKFYMGRYFWDEDCNRKQNKNQLGERFWTGLLQPFMELFGNGMTAHFWHFNTIKILESNYKENHKENYKNYELVLESSLRQFRIFDKGFIVAVLTSAWVDINPFQTCAIIKPTKDNTDILWKIFFATDVQNGLFQEEKCSHRGAVKVVIDGQGSVWGRDINGNFIELEIVEYCKAYQNTHILFV